MNERQKKHGEMNKSKWLEPSETKQHCNARRTLTENKKQKKPCNNLSQANRNRRIIRNRLRKHLLVGPLRNEPFFASGQKGTKTLLEAHAAMFRPWQDNPMFFAERQLCGSTDAITENILNIINFVNKLHKTVRGGTYVVHKNMEK